MEGQDTQIDKYIIERMFEPLLHLVRNSVSHGIESAEERMAAGKNTVATILLKASAAGDLVIFTIEDDGRGIDRKQILRKAVAQGIIDKELKADDNTILNLMCAPGFTTRDQSDLASGRGIGMDVVKKTVSELGGSISFESEEGKMTRFTIHLPLTLSIVDALIVSSVNSVFAIPMPSVNEVARISRNQIVNAENVEMFSYRDIVIPLIRLERYFNIGNSSDEFFDVLIVGKGIDRVAIAIDKIIGKREIVVRSLMDPLVKVEGIYGATELGDARIVLILDAQALVTLRSERIRL
jgi:two-component system chemotaxis sensor kinase CheA